MKPMVLKAMVLSLVVGVLLVACAPQTRTQAIPTRAAPTVMPQPTSAPASDLPLAVKCYHPSGQLRTTGPIHPDCFGLVQQAKQMEQLQRELAQINSQMNQQHYR